MNVVVIAPHPDDDAIGCGGTICLHTRRGDRVAVVCLTSGELGLKSRPREEAWRVREREAELAASVMSVAEVHFLRCPDWYLETRIGEAASALRPILAREAPDVLYLPHEGESHPDHRVAATIVRRALEGWDGTPPTPLTYEVWTPMAECYHVENVTPVMREKLAAIRCHASQVELLPYTRAILGLNLYRGATAGACTYAEIFQTTTLQALPGATT